LFELDADDDDGDTRDLPIRIMVRMTRSEMVTRRSLVMMLAMLLFLS
jgi:hypothetical protein